MIYKPFHGLQLSALGLGTMRLPLVEGTKDIDIPQVETMVARAIAQGVNYFDTAYGYHGGQSETVMGQVLSAYPRESYFLATKFPGFNLENMGRVSEIFEDQLKKCRVDYFDFYLFHNVCEKNIDWYLDPKFGLLPYLLEQKKAGRIRHLGFSCHGSITVLRRFLEACGDALEFGQLQVNWLDWEFQNAKEKCALLREFGLDIWVMEPLRGGKLCQLSADHRARLEALEPGTSLPAWGFRFLKAQAGVTMILSGMSNLQQIEENTATFRTEAPLDEAQVRALLEIGREMTATTALPCTACRYCTDTCPQSLDIPWLLEQYNRRVFPESGGLTPEPLAGKTGPDACVGCRRCEKLCPQGIKISQVMKKFASL